MDLRGVEVAAWLRFALLRKAATLPCGAPPCSYSNPDVPLAKPRRQRLAWLLSRGGVAGWLAHELNGTEQLQRWPELRGYARWQQLVMRDRLELQSAAARRLQALGVPWLLLKGATLARNYELPWLRPWGDLDLMVPQDQTRIVEAALRPLCRHGLALDVHAAGLLPGVSFEQLMAASTCAEVLGGRYPTLSREHAFRHAVLHAAKHGLARPVWLLDLALYPAVHLNDSGMSAEELMCLELVSSLIRRVLGVSLQASAVGLFPLELPRWLETQTLAAWGAMQVSIGTSIHTALRRPWLWPTALRLVWPNGLRAAVATGRIGHSVKHGPLRAQLELVHARAGEVLARTFATKQRGLSP